MKKLHPVLKSILGDLNRLARAAAAIEENIDRLTYELADAIQTVDPDAEVPLVRLDGARLYREAAAGVDMVFIGYLPDARGEFLVDGKELILSPKLTAFLAVISRPDGLSQDHLVTWKDKSTVAKELKTSTHAVENLAFRLRRELEKAGVNPYLIQTKPLFVRMARKA